MAKEIYFLHQIKHNSSNNTYDKGIVVKDSENESNWEAVQQSYHAYLGAYAYGKDANTDYVQCEVTDKIGNRLLFEVWEKKEAQQASEK